MRQYYIYDGQTKKGPFDIEELKSQPLTKETPVWYEGLLNWTLAAEVAELAPYLHRNGLSTPPPVPVEFSTKPAAKNDILASFGDAQEIFVEQKRNRFLVPVIVLLLVAAVMAVVFFYKR